MATTLSGGASTNSATSQSFVRVGLAPTVFLVWRVYSPLRSLLSHLTVKLVVQAGFGPANASVSDSCRNRAWRLDNGSGCVRRSCTSGKEPTKPICAVSLCHATLKFRWDMWELNPLSFPYHSRGGIVRMLMSFIAGITYFTVQPCPRLGFCAKIEQSTIWRTSPKDSWLRTGRFNN